jgi:ankyrin repeat protein
MLPDKSPLHVAVDQNDLPYADSLICAGADVNSFIWGGYTPLHCVHSTQMTELLLKAGAEIDARNWDEGSSGITPLLMAIVMRRNEVATYLLEQGANPTHEDLGERTPLWVAADRRDWGLVDLLLSKGADLEQCWDYGGEVAVHGGSRSVRAELSFSPA